MSCTWTVTLQAAIDALVALCTECTPSVSCAALFPVRDLLCGSTETMDLIQEAYIRASELATSCVVTDPTAPDPGTPPVCTDATDLDTWLSAFHAWVSGLSCPCDNAVVVTGPNHVTLGYTWSDVYHAWWQDESIWCAAQTGWTEYPSWDPAKRIATVSLDACLAPHILTFSWAACADSYRLWLFAEMDLNETSQGSCPPGVARVSEHHTGQVAPWWRWNEFADAAGLADYMATLQAAAPASVVHYISAPTSATSLELNLTNIGISPQAALVWMVEAICPSGSGYSKIVSALLNQHFDGGRTLEVYVTESCVGLGEYQHIYYRAGPCITSVTFAAVLHTGQSIHIAGQANTTPDEWVSYSWQVPPGGPGSIWIDESVHIVAEGALGGPAVSSGTFEIMEHGSDCAGGAAEPVPAECPDGLPSTYTVFITPADCQDWGLCWACDWWDGPTTVTLSRTASCTWSASVTMWTPKGWAVFRFVITLVTGAEPHWSLTIIASGCHGLDSCYEGRKDEGLTPVGSYNRIRGPWGATVHA